MSKKTIKNWHYGKIALLWIWCITLFIVMAQLLGKIENPIFGSLIISIILGMPIVMSVITWKWLSGKESEGSNSEDKVRNGEY